MCVLKSDCMYQGVPLYVRVKPTWMRMPAGGGAHPGGCA